MIGPGLGGAHLRWWGRGEAYLMQEKLKASNRKKLIKKKIIIIIINGAVQKHPKKINK